MKLTLVAVSVFSTKDLNSNCSFAAILLFKRKRKNECSTTRNINGGHRKCALLIAGFQLTSLRLWHAGGQEQRGNVWRVARKRKDERGSTLSLRAALHTLPLFYLRTSIWRGYERKNYATVEIHPEGWLTIISLNRVWNETTYFYAGIVNNKR